MLFRSNPAGFLFGVPTTDIVQGYFAGGTLKTNAVALFGQASYEVTPDLKLTVGGRYSRETKKVDEVLQFDFSRTYDPNNPLIPLGTAMQKTKESSFDPRVALEYQVSDNVFAYASFSKGFKSGGFNVGNLQPAFKPEEITDYEVGLKTELFDGRLRANVTAFWYDYTNLQVSVIRDTALLTENAASAELKGFEVELQAAPTPELRLNASFSYLDGTYTKIGRAHV